MVPASSSVSCEPVSKQPSRTTDEICKDMMDMMSSFFNHRRQQQQQPDSCHRNSKSSCTLVRRNSNSSRTLAHRKSNSSRILPRNMNSRTLPRNMNSRSLSQQKPEARATAAGLSNARGIRTSTLETAAWLRNHYSYTTSNINYYERNRCRWM
jgi:hypothetical protein